MLIAMRVAARCAFQLLLEETSAPVPSYNSITGSESAPRTGSEGPNPRRATFFGSVPVMMKPPMSESSPGFAAKRVETFSKLLGFGGMRRCDFMPGGINPKLRYRTTVWSREKKLASGIDGKVQG